MLDHVGTGQSLRHDPVDEVVAHEVTGVHQDTGPATQFGTVGHRRTQHVAGGDVDGVVGLDQTGGLGSLARPLTAKDDQMHRCHGYLRKPS